MQAAAYSPKVLCTRGTISPSPQSLSLSQNHTRGKSLSKHISSVLTGEVHLYKHITVATSEFPVFIFFPHFFFSSLQVLSFVLSLSTAVWQPESTSSDKLQASVATSLLPDQQSPPSGKQFSIEGGGREQRRSRKRMKKREKDAYTNARRGLTKCLTAWALTAHFIIERFPTMVVLLEIQVENKILGLICKKL